MNKTCRFGFFILGLGGGLLLASCATTGAKRSNSAAAVLDSKTARLTRFDELLGTLHTSLGALERSAATNPREPYKTFSTTTKSLAQEAKAIEKEAQAMPQQTRQRFELWQKEIASIQDEELRGNAEKRREQEMAKSGKIEASLYKLVEAYAPLETKLKDVHTVLDNDLNGAGVASASHLIAAVKSDAQSLQTEIQQMVQTIEKVSIETAPRPSAKASKPAETESTQTQETK